MLHDVPQGRITLKRGRTKAIAMHHPWVFTEAIERLEGSPSPGDLVDVLDPVGRFIGRGYFSAESKLPVKVFSWKESERIDADFWRGRLARAIALRSEFLKRGGRSEGVRLVNAEGDGVPGLVVDRYADYLTVELLTVGMAARVEMLVTVLAELTGAKGVFERPEAEVSRFENLSRAPGVLWGEEPPDAVEITEGSARFLVDLRRGQKTGFYLDQRDNRMRVGELSRGRHVLDAFCYTGGFAIHAALGGAASVTAVDSSGPSLEIAQRSAELNGAAIAFEKGNAFERLRMLRREGRTFDLIVVDPPKLARGRSGVEKALGAYKDANLSALKLLNPGGLLVTCSCSGIITREDFLRALNDAAVDAGRPVQVVESRGASADHPFDPACPQTDYLQCVIARVGE